MLTPFPARAEILFQPGRVVDTSTGLVWLNVWEADAFVRQLGDEAGGWRHATDNEVDALLAHAEGRSPGPGFLSAQFLLSRPMDWPWNSSGSRDSFCRNTPVRKLP